MRLFFSSILIIPSFLALFWTWQNQNSTVLVSRDIAAIGKTAEEGLIQFEGRIFVRGSAEDGDRPPSKKDALVAIQDQIRYMFGPMEQGPKFNQDRAAPKGDHEIEVFERETWQLVAGEKNLWEVKYNYSGNIVVEKGESKTYRIYLPLDPKTIYQKAMSKPIFDPETKKYVCPCADPHYANQEEFFYFWGPKEVFGKCHFVQGQDYIEVKAKLERSPRKIPNTYPEYDRLADYDYKLKRDVIDIHILFGKDIAHRGQNPATTKDDQGKTYRDARAELVKKGFVFEAWSDEKIKEVMPGITDPKARPFVEDAILNFDNGRPSVRIRLFYGQTDIESKYHEAYQYFLRDSIWKSSILIYDGHSSLGKSSDLTKIKEDRGKEFKFRFPSDRYQIFFFNSCSSYSYYNAQFFERKWKANDMKASASANFDMLANGISTDFGHVADIALVDAVLKSLEGPGPSWKEIVKTVDNNNLAVVVGAEDNPETPRSAKVQRRSCKKVFIR